MLHVMFEKWKRKKRCTNNKGRARLFKSGCTNACVTTKMPIKLLMDKSNTAIYGLTPRDLISTTLLKNNNNRLCYGLIETRNRLNEHMYRNRFGVGIQTMYDKGTTRVSNFGRRRCYSEFIICKGSTRQKAHFPQYDCPL